MQDRPNILFILTDQERQRDWLPATAHLPHRRRLLDEGLEFTQHYTHTSPCSPSRATLFTGRYMAEHGVSENSSTPSNTGLRKDIDTIGHVLRRRGYRTAYKGKWHLEAGAHPDLDAYGFGDWEGNDEAFWGLAGSGTEYDPFIAGGAVKWLDEHGGGPDPWFLVVALVNPHDVMWFPLDQPWWADQHPEIYAEQRRWLETFDWGRTDNLPLFTHDVPEHFAAVPDNFDDDLFTKPEVHRRFMTEFGNNGAMEMRRDDHAVWRRQLDYYVRLHELNDVHLGNVLAALDRTGSADETIVVFTSDHGDQCGSHGLRSKGPWNYQETMRIPLYMRVPGLTVPGTVTRSLTSSIDVTATIADLAGAADDARSMAGASLRRILSDPSAAVRDHVLFAQRWPWYSGVEQTRYASSGVFDGRHKYCRYYGIGGGADASGRVLPGPMLFGPDAPFEEHDHEWYDLREDPGELVNLANDRGRRNELRIRFDELIALEAQAWSTL